jgi:hypothetical protein
VSGPASAVCEEARREAVRFAAASSWRTTALLEQVSRASTPYVSGAVSSRCTCDPGCPTPHSSRPPTSSCMRIKETPVTLRVGSLSAPALFLFFVALECLSYSYKHASLRTHVCLGSPNTSYCCLDEPDNLVDQSHRNASSGRVLPATVYRSHVG